MTARCYCHRCGLSLLIADAPTVQTEHLTCSDCRRPYWCSPTGANGSYVCGVRPHQAEQFAAGAVKVCRRRVLP